MQNPSTTRVSSWYISLDFIFMFRVDISISSCGSSWKEENTFSVICFFRCVFPSTEYLHSKVSNFFCFIYKCYYETNMYIDIPAQISIIQILYFFTKTVPLSL